MPFIHAGFMKYWPSSCFLKYPHVILYLVAIRWLEKFLPKPSDWWLDFTDWNGGNEK